MEVISSKSFEEDSSDDYNQPINNNNKLLNIEHNNISENLNIQEIDNENNLESESQNELNGIKEISGLDDDDDEEESENNNLYNNYEENNLRDNNTINSIEEEDDEENQTSNENIILNKTNKRNHINNMSSLQSSTQTSEHKAIQFILFENDKYIISSEAKSLFTQKNYEKICLISFVGKCKTGKSFILNKILAKNNNNGFLIGSKNIPCTKGI